MSRPSPRRVASTQSDTRWHADELPAQPQCRCPGLDNHHLAGGFTCAGHERGQAQQRGRAPPDS
eukprot:8943029-Pyramimonas_sp.AAC.1